MERKLASIQKIISLDPIPEADKIEKATVLGWEVVVEKGIHKVGDLVVYFEIDSLLPKKSWSEFLFRDKDKSDRYRLKTVKLKGQVSQGLIVPLSILSVEQNNNNGIQEWQEGEDITDLLDIKKYEPYIPANLQGVIKSTFPYFIPKTDEDRIQTIPIILTKYRGQMCYVTEKIDGSSMTVYLRDGEFGVCSRNIDLKESDENAYWKKAREIKLENKLKKLQGNWALQGELCGQGIQKNIYQMKTTEFLIYNMFNIDKHSYLSFMDMLFYCTDMGLSTVPIISTHFMLDGDVQKFVSLSKGNSILNKKVKREGIVVRTRDLIIDPKYGRVSFKVVNPDFLLKYDE